MTDNASLFDDFGDFALSAFAVNQHPQLEAAVINAFPATAAFFQIYNMFNHYVLSCLTAEDFSARSAVYIKGQPYNHPPSF
jgi:hypothetical protein